MIREPIQPSLPHRSGLGTMDRRKPLLALTAACLLLVLYIGFLVISNFQSQLALRDASRNRFRLDLEKRADSLGYFFLERKYDLNALALSSEINSYFVNKALGMSEQYGLKVNLFMIRKRLERILAYRQINGHRLYSRLVFIDNSGKQLVDTDNRAGDPLEAPKAAQGPPRICFGSENRHRPLRMSVSCLYKNQIVGQLLIWFDEETLFSHFVNLDGPPGLCGAGLIDEQGQLHWPDARSHPEIASQLTPGCIKALPKTGFSSNAVASGGEVHEILMARVPIPNLNLSYLAWMPSKQIAGALAPMRLIMGMGALAAVVLVSLGLILRFSAQNLILKTRFDEAARQQDVLALKNSQLRAEIEKRENAEKELAVQRTVRMRSDRLRSLGEMAAGIAHELNQPLVGVRGYAELMLDSLDEGLELPPETIRQNTGKIVEQAERMVHIINHVRLFARDAGSTETTVVDLNEVVRSGLNLLTAQFKSHGLLLKNEMADGPLSVCVNSFSVEEVLLNLLTNARDSVEHRATIENGVYQPRILVATGVHNGGVKEAFVVVEDNGIGIPANAAEKIFDPFFTTKDPDKGTGLGLSICKSIVESFQGRIHFATTENQGTRFEIVFPECAQ
ncbi:hypothetical protein DSCA_64600 [Desulfosarcina alkanivorans]|uniref:histidine kinase n=1 Tax=Desulfosarcina alkanivorans TaxID=571177 RepID=A0A5K7YW22_9BACT|nr:ATP-binding protein [Desulfosarcina alkanivorans]BBO72530.1 hypothetical protein DSCA_64600 [Desulfosarcina alkanivorans]